MGATAADKRLRPLTLADGLSDLLINTIYRDSTGYIWFGTETSLDRFDGNKIRRFKIDTPTRGSRRVRDILQAPDGNIYAATNAGLFMVDNHATALTQVEPATIDVSVNALHALPHSRKILAGTTRGLYTIDLANHTVNHRLVVDDNLSRHNNIIDIDTDTAGNIFLLTPWQLAILNRTHDTLHTYPLNSRSAATTMLRHGSRLLIGTDGDGLYTFDTSSRTFEAPVEIGNGIITSMTPANDNLVLIATDGDGLVTFSPVDRQITARLTSAPDSPVRLRSNSVYSVLNDIDRILWIGYYQSGADYMPRQPDNVKLYTPLDNPEASQWLVRALKHTDDYTLVGTHNGLIVIDHKNGRSYTIDKPQIASSLIFAIEYLDGYFYIGTYHGGLYRLNAATGSIHPFGPDTLAQSTIFALTPREGSLWAATSSGIYRFDNGNPNPALTLTANNSHLPEGNVYEIFFDSKGRGWFCTEEGLAVYNGESIVTNGFAQGFPAKLKIRTIYEDSRGNLYLAPDRGPLWRTDLALRNFLQLDIGAEGRFSQFTSIIEDREGNLWIGTDKGLVQYFRDGHFHLYNNVDNVLNPVYTLAKPFEDSKGRIYIGSTTGIHEADPDIANHLHVNLHHPLVITGAQSGTRDITPIPNPNDGQSPHYTIKLDPQASDLTIDVSQLEFTDPHSFEVEYMLQGIDPAWRHTDGTSPIVYRDIPTGHHSLLVRTPGNDLATITIAIYKPRNLPSPLIWTLVALALLIVLAVVFMTIQKRRHRHEIATLKASQTSTQDTADDLPYRNMRLSDEECRRLKKQLDAYMTSQQPYRDANLKIAHLASAVGVSTHALSFLFNQYLKKSYYDYVNEYRVNEFKRLAGTPDIARYTLSTLAEKCGFSSRASFFRHFKSITGMTPAEYLKQK